MLGAEEPTVAVSRLDRGAVDYENEQQPRHCARNRRMATNAGVLRFSGYHFNPYATFRAAMLNVPKLGCQRESPRPSNATVSVCTLDN